MIEEMLLSFATLLLMLPGFISAGGEQLASCNDTRVVVAYLVYSKHRRLVYDYGKNFSEGLFAHAKDSKVEFRYLPPVQSEACGEAAFKRKKTIFDPARGSILTHINVWDHFWRRRRKHCEGNSTHMARANVDNVRVHRIFRSVSVGITHTHTCSIYHRLVSTVPQLSI